MALVLNGNGTITGLAVGGVPDGSITSANIASGTLTAGKFATSPTRNNIVKVQHFTDNTRTNLSANSSDNILWSFTYSKVTSTNDVICLFNLPFEGSAGSTACFTYMKMIHNASSTEERDNGAYGHYYNGYEAYPCLGIAHFTASNGTGNYTMRIGWDCTGSSPCKPGANYCPQESAGDDTRLGNSMATCTVIEYTPA